MNKGRSFSFYANRAMVQEIKKEMASTGLRDYAELCKILVWESLQKRKKHRKQKEEVQKRVQAATEEKKAKEKRK